ncbi:Ger(x)C family spore germination protein [Alicyclobacillus curvatus]|nr:Ger(x)C family spore germination protein [Alicyclobacillus curvatus]
MRQHSLTLVFCALCCVFLTTGCWDMRELNTRALVISSAIDVSDNGLVVLTDQFANPSALGHNLEKPADRFFTMSETGKTVLQAAQVLQTRLPRYIFIGHRRNIFIGQATAEHGLQEILDEFTRAPDSRIRTDLSIVKGARGSDVLKIPSQVEKLPSIAALKSRTVVGGGQPGSTFVDFLMSASSKTSCPTLPLVEIQSRPDDYASEIGDEQLRFAGRAVFDKHLHMVGTINYMETVYRFWEVGSLTHQTLAVSIPKTDQYVSVYVNHLKSKLVPKLQNRHLTVSVYLSGDGRIGENNAKLDLMKEASRLQVQTALDNQIASDVSRLIRRVQNEYHTDIFRFDRACQMRYPLLFPRLSDAWPEIFSNATVHVYVDVHIKTVGEAGLPLHQHVEM